MRGLFVDQAALGAGRIRGLGLGQCHDLGLQSIDGAVQLLEQLVQFADMLLEKGELDFEVGDSVVHETPPRETIPLLVIVRASP